MSRIKDIFEIDLKIQTTDFIKRNRHDEMWIIVLIYMVGVFLILTASLNHEYFGGYVGLFFIILGVLGGLVLYALYSIQRSHDLITDIEFQNALFSSAVKKNYDFTIFLGKDGSICYADPGFKRLFPDVSLSNDHALEDFMASCRFDLHTKERMLDAILSNQHEYFLINLPQADGVEIPFHISLDTLSRPVGYFIVKGRKFIEDRNADNDFAESGFNESLHDILNTHFIPLLDQMPTGLYVATSDGHMRYMNKMLMHWLGFESGDNIANNFSFYDLIFHQNGKQASYEDLVPFNMPMMFRCKNGHLIKINISQTVDTDSKGNVRAVMGMVTKIG